MVWHSRDRSVACGIKKPQTIKICLDFSISSLFCESSSLSILGEMVIIFDFPLVWFIRFFCLFMKRKKIYFISDIMYCRCPVKIQYERMASRIQIANREGMRRGTKCYF